MKRFAIGDGLTCDLDRLVDTRAAVQRPCIGASAS